MHERIYMKKISFISLCLILFILLFTSCSSDNSTAKYYHYGVAAYQAGDYELAESYFTKAIGYKDSDIYIESIAKKRLGTEMTTTNETHVTASSVTFLHYTAK